MKTEECDQYGDQRIEQRGRFLEVRGIHKRRSVQVAPDALPFIRLYFTETMVGLIYSTSMKSQQGSTIQRSMRNNSAGIQKLYIIYYQPQGHPCFVLDSLDILPKY